MKKPKSSTTSGKGVYSTLGIDRSDGKNKKKKQLTRKELRKQGRDVKKSGQNMKSSRVISAAPQDVVHNEESRKRVATGDAVKVASLNVKGTSNTGEKVVLKKPRREVEESVLNDGENHTSIDPFIDAENKEIARLEKLMGIKGGKSGSKLKCAAKLNKEYELFEGIGSNFGDFLMDLDDLTDMIEGKGNKKQIFAGDSGADSDDESPDEVKAVSHLIDDDEQEQSDLEAEIEDDSDDESDGSDMDEYNFESNDIAEGEEENDSGEEDNGGDKDEEDEEVGQDGADADLEDKEEDDDEDDSENENEGDSDEDDDRDMSSHTYQPTKGEDIYGRLTDDSNLEKASGGKYVPPARRAQLLATIDESSESVKIVRRQMNGLMNRLSDQSKDSVVRSVKAIFDSNSLSVANTVLKDCVMAACSNPSQLMVSLIPIYAAMIAALHVAVGADVGAFIVESLATSLHTAIEKERKLLIVFSSGGADGNKYISSKLSNNALLLLVYLYNLRVLHHTLIVDLMTLLAGSFQNLPTTNSSSHDKKVEAAACSSGVSEVAIGELEVELLVCLVDHCGAQLRSDDPLGLKTAITTLNKRSAVQSAAGNAAGSTRLKFMLEALTDLRNNKSRRIQSANAEVVKGLRHWLGSVKNSIGGGRAGADLCLRVSLNDLLDAEKTGRWWKAGASWAGKGKQGIITSAGDDSEGEQERVVKKKSSGNPEEEKLLLLAHKMRFNTATRRNIFVVIMSSRDIDDAFERLQRLELKGKQDREVVRVIIECCAQEKSYNAFYSELAAMLCAHNRQYKTSIQFIFWDNFKLFEDEVPGRRTVNLARMLAHLVAAFHLPLASLKPMDMTDLNANMVLFLATFFMALFSAKITEETFQTLLDRVATTKDFSTVRDNIIFFLQSHLQKIPSGLDPIESKAMEKRRKIAVKTMEAMSCLDMAAGAMEQEEQDDMGAAAEKRSKRSI